MRSKEATNRATRKYRAKSNYASTKKYEKTPKGFLVRLYRNMKSRVKGISSKPYLYLGKEILTKEEFYKWALENQDYAKLYKIYIDSNFDRKLSPSVDRIDSSKGYSIDNMEFVTMSENSRRGVISKNKMKKNGNMV